VDVEHTECPPSSRSWHGRYMDLHTCSVNVSSH
jgi:hypothetical protein